MAFANAHMQMQHKAPADSNQFDDLFDLFVDSEHYDSSDTTTDRSSSGDWGSFFEFQDSSVSDLPASPREQGNERRQSQVAPDEAVAQKENSGCGENSRPKSYIPGSSHTLPRSSASNKTKKNAANVSGAQRRTYSAGVNKSNRKSSFSPKMAQPSVSRRSMQDLWLQRIEASVDKFDFTSQYQALPISPPPTSKLPQLGSNDTIRRHGGPGRASSSQQNLCQGYTSLASHNSSSALQGQFTPISTPLMGNDQLHSRMAQTIPSTPASTHSNYHAFSPSFEFFTSPQTDRSTSWSYDQSFSFATSPDFNDTKVQPWWPPSSNMASAHESCDSPAYQSQSYASTAANLMSHEDGHSFSGAEPHFTQLPANALMIQYGDASESAIDDSSDLVDPFDDAERNTPTSAPSYTAVPSAARAPAQPYPQHQQHPPTQSPSPSPATQPSTPARSRRGSRGTHRRSKTGSSSGGKSGGAALGSPAGGGFVNYTPSDSRKILTGVAPSGSSKTKARREKEAAEKRRRLSMAAARVVMEAGGDISALEREGFCF